LGIASPSQSHAEKKYHDKSIQTAHNPISGNKNIAPNRRNTVNNLKKKKLVGNEGEKK
jgi:hypothetical protein